MTATTDGSAESAGAGSESTPGAQGLPAGPGVGRARGPAAEPVPPAPSRAGRAGTRAEYGPPGTAGAQGVRSAPPTAEPGPLAPPAGRQGVATMPPAAKPGGPPAPNTGRGGGRALTADPSPGPGPERPGRTTADLPRPPEGTRPGVYEAAARATRNLLDRQDPEGWWKGDLETNVTMDAEDLLLRQFLGIRDEATTRAAALFIRGEQREDGTWATFHGGPPELSATIEAYV
ncbi:hypothetical protein ACFCXH_42230, partial [Streptomyces nojiriensis]